MNEKRGKGEIGNRKERTDFWKNTEKGEREKVEGGSGKRRIEGKRGKIGRKGKDYRIGF